METEIKQTPLIILSDSPSCTSGLGRITRDLTTRIHEHLSDIYRVATVGYGGPGSSHFPWPDYHIHSIENWLVPELPIIAEDFAPGEEVILLTIWDASRVGWIADPRQCPVLGLRRWVEGGKVRKWTYTPVDGEGPNGGMSIRLANTLKGFERVLNYSEWSSGVTGYPDHLPHGIDTSVFTPRDRKEARKKFINDGFIGLGPKSFLIGIVATNQARKDWALGIQTARILVDRGLDVRIWCHTDSLERFWDLGALIVDYGLQGRVVITTANYTDVQMSWLYSACDVTLGIGLGEGWGLPLAESIACGTPVVHGNYGGGAEFLPKRYLVEPVAYRYEGPYCVKRPVFGAEDWADKAEQIAGELAEAPEYIKWENTWPKWEEWLRKGVKK